MKIYIVGDDKRQYNEGEQPEGAVEYISEKAIDKPENKALTPANKSKGTKTK